MNTEVESNLKEMERLAAKRRSIQAEIEKFENFRNRTDNQLIKLGYAVEALDKTAFDTKVKEITEYAWNTDRYPRSENTWQ